MCRLVSKTCFFIYLHTPEEAALSPHWQTGRFQSKYLVVPVCCLPTYLLRTQAVMCTTGELMLLLCADIEPDLKVRAAMNEINAAQRLRRAERHAIIAPSSISDMAYLLLMHFVDRLKPHYCANTWWPYVLCYARRVAAVEKAEAEKLQVVMAAQGDAEAKYLQGQARRLVSFSSSCHLLPVQPLIVVPAQLPDRAPHLPVTWGLFTLSGQQKCMSRRRPQALNALPA